MYKLKYVNAKLALLASTACFSLACLSIPCQAFAKQDSKSAETAPDGTRPTTLSGGITVNLERDFVPMDHMRGLVIKVTNQSQEPVLVNCDAARVIVPSVIQCAATLEHLELVENPKQSFVQLLGADTKSTLVAGLTVGMVPAVKGVELQHGPYLERYGKDERRRQIEVGRFGKRLLWPNESSSGTVYFKTDQSLRGAELEIPVSLPFAGMGTGTALSTRNVSTRIQE